VSAIGLDIVSTFRKMSTKPDQVHILKQSDSTSSNGTETGSRNSRDRNDDR
jgi:hypothetical protein